MFKVKRRDTQENNVPPITTDYDGNLVAKEVGSGSGWVTGMSGGETDKRQIIAWKRAHREGLESGQLETATSRSLLCGVKLHRVQLL